VPQDRALEREDEERDPEQEGERKPQVAQLRRAVGGGAGAGGRGFGGWRRKMEGGRLAGGWPAGCQRRRQPRSRGRPRLVLIKEGRGRPRRHQATRARGCSGAAGAGRLPSPGRTCV
jgi:hypothetical protein